MNQVRDGPKPYAFRNGLRPSRSHSARASSTLERVTAARFTGRQYDGSTTRSDSPGRLAVPYGHTSVDPSRADVDSPSRHVLPCHAVRGPPSHARRKELAPEFELRAGRLKATTFPPGSVRKCDC